MRLSECQGSGLPLVLRSILGPGIASHPASTVLFLKDKSLKHKTHQKQVQDQGKTLSTLLAGKNLHHQALALFTSIPINRPGAFAI